MANAGWRMEFIFTVLLSLFAISLLAIRFYAASAASFLPFSIASSMVPTM